MRICVLGGGAWGSALGKVLQENGNAVTMWDIDPGTLESLREGRNEKYLPEVALPRDWKVESDFAKAVGGRECLILAIPSRAERRRHPTRRHPRSPPMQVPDGPLGRADIDHFRRFGFVHLRSCFDAGPGSLARRWVDGVWERIGYDRDVHGFLRIDNGSREYGRQALASGGMGDRHGRGSACCRAHD